MDNRALVLLSGGLDSTVALAEAINQRREVTPLFFSYGQVNKKMELRAAKDVCTYYGLKLQIERITVPSFKDPKRALTNEHAKDRSVYLPCRNLIFLSIAVALAEADRHHEVWTGFVMDEGHKYPDTSPAFVRAFELTALLGSKADPAIVLQTPLMSMGKLGVIELAVELEVPWEITRSCASSGTKPCSVCQPCRERVHAVNEFLALG